jgi:hypothetical protein
MTEWSSHFETFETWADAAGHVEFTPRVPTDTAGCDLISLAVHVMDHRGRRLPSEERSLEAHYGRFVIDQKRASTTEDARRAALETFYGPDPVEVTIGGSVGRRYALGPPVDADDVDGRSPAIVVWSVSDVVYLIASTELDDTVLMAIAASMHT